LAQGFVFATKELQILDAGELFELGFYYIRISIVENIVDAVG
jgi:hypothetical protein